MTYSWPVIVLAGLLLYKRYLGTPEQREHFAEIDRIMARSAGLKVEEPVRTEKPVQLHWEKAVAATATPAQAKTPPK